MEACLEYLRENGADPAIVIDPHTVITAPWPRLRCQFGCESYGHNHCCPPEAPDYTRTRAVLDSYSTAILFRIHHYGASRMPGGAGQLFHRRPVPHPPLRGQPHGLGVRPAAVSGGVLQGPRLRQRAVQAVSGPCKLCPACDPAGCRFPGKAIPSMEGCGIDVFATARAHGLEIHTLREMGEEHSHFGLILVE